MKATTCVEFVNPHVVNSYLAEMANAGFVLHSISSGADGGVWIAMQKPAQLEPVAQADADLLAACEAAEHDLDEAIERLPKGFCDREDYQRCVALRTQLRAAIAKAKGRPGMMAETTKAVRPEFCTDEHLEVLDQLPSGTKTERMWLLPGLNLVFPDLSKEQAIAILTFWMHDDRHGEKRGPA